MAILYFILGAFARRWFGGMFPDDKYKILGNRGLQTVFMCLLFLSIFINTDCWQNVVMAFIITAWLQIQYWSRGHGACFDIGRDVSPEKSTIERYNERWYHDPCDFIFDKILHRPLEKYGFLYDFLYMGLRYTCPMIPMMLIDTRFIFIGLVVSPIYAFCWTLYEKETWISPQASWLNAPTKWAELIVGGMTYAGVYLIWG